VTLSEARRLLLRHGGLPEDDEGPEAIEDGFLGSLRPYRGLREDHFHEVMEALRVAAPLLEAPRLDRQLVSALWGMCHFARAWGVHPDGMLRDNKLISDEDVARLEKWVSDISYAVAMILDGSRDSAFEDYQAP